MMEGIDTNWCLGCDSHYSTSDAEPYCSAKCLRKHQQEAEIFTAAAAYRSSVPPSPQPVPVHHNSRRRLCTPSSSSHRSESFSELDLNTSYRPSPVYPFASSSSCRSHASFHSSGSSQAHAWVGQGVKGIPAWAATIPYGQAPDEPSSSTTSSPRHSRRSSTSSSVAPPSRPRTRASMTSSSGSQYLRPAALDLSPRKPAPPRLDRKSNVSHVEHSTCHGTTSVVSVSSPPTPTIHSKSMATVTPYTSLPSLACSAASVSVTSIVTPGSLLHTGSRPTTPPESEHGDDAPSVEHFEVVEKLKTESSVVARVEEQGQKKGKADGIFANFTQRFKAWAASNEFADSQIGVSGRQRVSSQHGQVSRNKTAPAPQQQQQQPQQAPVRQSFLSRRPKEPVSFFHDEELAYDLAGQRQGSVRIVSGEPWQGERAVGWQRAEGRLKEKKEKYPTPAYVPFSFHGRL